MPRAAVGLAGSGLSIELPLGTVITSWQVDAGRVPMGRPNGFEPVLLGTGGEEPHAALYLPAPAQGDWIMRATVHSTAEDLTDYHWAVRVHEPGRPPAPGVGPPDGTLRGGQAFATAYEGSYCLGETCSDIGHLPTARISPLLRTGTADRELLFDLEGRSGFTTWEVTFWDARDDQGTDITHLAEGGRAGITTRRTDFATPPSGDWQVRIRVGFPEGGDATYYVHVIVP